MRDISPFFCKFNKFYCYKPNSFPKFAKLFILILLFMKKLIVAACSFLVAALVVSCFDQAAPTLVGQWQSDKVIKNDSAAGGWMVYTMTLNEDSTMQVGIDALQETKEKGSEISIPFKMSYGGKWSDQKDNIVFTPDSSSIKMELVKDSIKIKFDDPQMEMLGDKMIKSLVESFDKEMGPSLKKEFVSGSETNAYKLEGDKLTLIMKTDTVVLNRQKVEAAK